jgi:hypothetical protein
LDLLAWSSSWRNLAKGEACLAALALPPAPGEGRGDWEKPGEFGELVKLFGEAGEASGEHGGDPIASRSPGLPFACSPSLLSQRTSSLPCDTPRANPPSLTPLTPFSGSQFFTVIEGGSHFLGEGEFGRLRGDSHRLPPPPRLGVAVGWVLCWFQKPIRLVSPPEDIAGSLFPLSLLSQISLFFVHTFFLEMSFSVSTDCSSLHSIS